MPRDKVLFAANVPVEVALEYAQGKLCEGDYGDQYQYSLTGNRIAWVAPIVHKQIVELGIQPGELIIICKSVTKEGRASVTRWLVRRAETSGQLAVPKVEKPARAEAQNVPAPAARIAVERPAFEAASLPDHLTSSRLEHMTSLIADAMRAVQAAAAQTGMTITMDLDGQQTQALISTAVIDDQKRTELRYKYGGLLPAAQPNGASTWNGRAQ